MNDISIDLETLSTRHDAAILSIGAATFDRSTGEIGEQMYAEVEINEAMAHGHVSGSTLEWWMQQSDKARALFAPPQAKRLLGGSCGALDQLALLVVKYPGARVWGNGATFDITILEHAFTKTGLAIPWKFYDVRDMRTIVDAAAALGFVKRSIPFQGVEHNAIDDAIHQARVISACWQTVTVRPPSVEPGFPERDPSLPAEQQGIFHKFNVRRADGSSDPGGKHHGCRYFVIDMDHDVHAPAALLAYAESCAVTHGQLAVDLRSEFQSIPHAAAV